MSYIGNQVTSVPHVIDTFSGNSVTTSFGPLTRAPAGTAAIAVFVSGVYQTPGSVYTLNGDYILFNVAPALGFNNIVIHHLGNGTTTQVPSDGSVTGTKLAPNSIRGNNIVAGTITGNLIAPGSITANSFGVIDNFIYSNNIVAGAITGNLIATNSINASNTLNQLSITGNLIGTGAISANNFAGGGITSNVLASNLSISVSRISETLGINASVVGSNSSVGANVTLNILDGTVYYFNSNTSGNVTFNLRGNNSTLFDQAVQVGNTISVVVSLRHNTAAHRSGVNVAIDGGYINTTRANPDSGNIIFYAANTTANHSTISALESNMIGLSIFKKASNSYIVYLSQTIYGLS
jgi:hypothetical protein